MLCTAEALPVSSQEPSPSDRTSDWLLQLGRAWMPSDSVLFVLLVPPGTANTLLPPFHCPREALAVCFVYLLHLNHYLILDMLKVKNISLL